jgi:hypothetical protein
VKQQAVWTMSRFFLSLVLLFAVLGSQLPVLADETEAGHGRGDASEPQQGGPTDPVELEVFLDDWATERMKETPRGG